MDRRDFLRSTAVGATAPFMLSTSASGEQTRGIEGLWLREFQDDDFTVIARMLLDFQQGVTEHDELHDSEEEALSMISENIVAAGEPIADIYDTSSPEALERSLNYGPRLADTDVELVFSLLNEIEDAYEMDLPTAHILTASRRAFLMKSLVAATLNFHQACDAIVNADELTTPLRQDFYYSLLILLVEVVLAKYPFDYWIAWRTTRYVHNQFLVRARSILGSSGIAVIMKFIHWTLVRRQVSVDFTESFYDTLVTFALDHGQDIHDGVVEALGGVGENYTLERSEDYGVETRVDIAEDAAGFIATSLITPLTEVVELEENARLQTLEQAVIGYFDVQTLEAVIEAGGGGFEQEVVELLFSEPE